MTQWLSEGLLRTKLSNMASDMYGRKCLRDLVQQLEELLASDTASQQAILRRLSKTLVSTGALKTLEESIEDK